MSDLNEIKRKYKSLAEYIVEVDEYGKIIFLDNDAFCFKLNELTPTKRYINVIIWLRFLMERELITPGQISTIQKLIKKETSAQYREIQDYIQDVDEQGKIILLPHKEMWRKIYELGNSYELIHSKFEDLLTRNLISKNYIVTQWKSKQDIKQFFEKRYNSISKQEEREWQKNIKEYIRSDKPIIEKVKYLTELIADIKDIQLDLTDAQALKSRKKFLKILHKELKDKQYFELENRIEFSSELNKNVKTNKDTVDEVHRRFWEPLLSINPKSGEPYMTEKDFNIFLNNFFGNINEIKPLSWPDFAKVELQHGAALFIDKFSIDKMKITRILKNTFPTKFKGTYKNEYDNIKKSYNHKGNGKERIFKKIT